MVDGFRTASDNQRDLEGGFGFLRGRTRPATALIVAFIDEHVGDRQVDADGAGLRWGVESICEQLTVMGCQIAPATYYEHRDKKPTARQLRDAALRPKMLELSVYEGIPHLLVPVVVDPEKAAAALLWATQEM